MTRTPAEILHYLITHAEYEKAISLEPLSLDVPEPLLPEDVAEIIRLIRYVPGLLVKFPELVEFLGEPYSFYNHIQPMIDLQWVSLTGYQHLSLKQRIDSDTCIGIVMDDYTPGKPNYRYPFLRFWIGPNPNEARQHERETA